MNMFGVPKYTVNIDTIDKLTEPTACSLLDGTMELALEKVFPFQNACHSVPVQDGYVVVQPNYVWVNAGHYPLLVPIDGGDIVSGTALGVPLNNGEILT
jgi:hypothetical protein